MKSLPIPKEMRALQLSAYHQDPEQIARSLKVVTVPVPELKKGYVLIKIEAASCNPSDIAIMQNTYGYSKSLPTVPGVEASGTVIASGGGWIANWMVGQRVACAGQDDGPGTWAQYFVARADYCIPLRKDISFEIGAALIVNPLSAFGLWDQIQRGKHRAAIQTGAASSLGKMIVAIANKNKFPLVNVVRRKEQVDVLKKIGAMEVLVSTESNFEEDLANACKKYGVTIALDAIAGDSTGKMLKALNPNGEVVVYGNLSYEDCRDIKSQDLIFGDKKVRGFWLTPWLTDKGMLHTLMVSQKAQRLLADKTFQTEVRMRVALEKFPDALTSYMKEMTRGKVIIHPHA